jgi:phospholipid/cholesterol/gamma-HCH transport system substrate-binding protein
MKKYSLEMYVGVFVIAGLIAVAILAVRLGDLALFRSSYTLYAPFTSVAGLRQGSPVQVYGIEVGRVTSMRLDPERQEAVVELDINADVSVYTDGSATIRTMGLIGDKYVAIYPGGAGERLKPGETIAETNTPPDIEDLLGKYIFGEAQAK